MISKPFRFTATATQTVAHGEAGVNSTGPNNTTLFARELTLLRREQLAYTNASLTTALDSVMAAIPVTQSSAEFLATLTGGEMIAVLFTAQFPTIYGGDGAGLFSGIERYQYLTTRLVDAATSCSSLATAFGYIARKLSLPMPAQSHNAALLALYMLPAPIQSAALTAILKAPEMIVMGARLIADGLKATSASYAEKANVGIEHKTVYRPSELQLCQFSGENGRELAVRIPALSGNSLRHNLLRAPAATRLLTELGLTPDREVVPIGVERFLYSGGNTTKGARTPGAADLLEAKVRQLYPMIDALGGSFDQFVMTRSQVSIASWIVCRENNWITRRKTEGRVSSDESIFDLVSEATRTRAGVGGKDKESGQMIFSYETLAAQTQVLFEVSWQPYTRPLTIGATIAALYDWQATGGYIGARSAQGHSQFIAEWPASSPDSPDYAQDYLDYLRNGPTAEMRQGLTDSTFGSGVTLCTV